MNMYQTGYMYLWVCTPRVIINEMFRFVGKYVMSISSNTLLNVTIFVLNHFL